jgi:hypothetical protein
VTWLASLPSGVLVVGSLAIAMFVAALARIVVLHLVPIDERELVGSIAPPLMPALGATFAVLMALTLANEATSLRSSQDLVSQEAAQASRLAWAATTPGVDTQPIQDALLAYLQATRGNEWHRTGASEGDDPEVAEALQTLEHAVRIQADRTDLTTPTTTELLAALDAVTTARRARLAAASRELPTLYVLTLLVSGVALVLDAGALTIRSGWRTASLIVGLAAVVGLSMALLFAMTAPWDGPLIVSGEPIDIVIDDLQTGFFT